MCEKLVILNKPLKCNLNRVKLNCSPLYMWEAPSTTYGDISIDLISGLSKLLASCAPDLSSHVRGLDDRSFILVGEVVQCSATRAAAHSSARKERSVFPLTIMMLRGPGILSLR